MNKVCSTSRSNLRSSRPGPPSPTERHRAETFSRQLAEALLSEPTSFLVSAVELVPGVAGAIHNNLDSHGFTLLTYFTEALAYTSPPHQPTPSQAPMCSS